MTPYLTGPCRPRRARPFAAAAMMLVLGYAVGAAHSAAQGPPTERVVLQYDQERAELLVLIDAAPVARFSAAGLAVSGDVTFSGALYDTGNSDDAPAD